MRERSTFEQPPTRSFPHLYKRGRKLGCFAGRAYADPNQVLGDLVKRLVNGVMLLLGALAFFLVPIGNKTSAQHLVAIFSTPPAKEAAVAFARAGKQMTERVMAQVERAKKNPSDMKIKPAPLP